MNKEYKIRIDRVIQYIDDNLSRHISLDDVAKISHFSAFHFHRIFSGILGETVNDYIVRRRLERAIHLLIFKTERSITHVALDCGFSSSANFSKAVKNYFGFSPSDIRNPKNADNSKIGKIYSKYGKAFNPSHLYPNRFTNDVNITFNTEDTTMNIEVREVTQQRVCTLASTCGYEPSAIYEAWDKLIEWATHNGIPAEKQQRFAFAYSNPAVTPIDKCRYEAGIVIDEKIIVKPPFAASEIPQGKYAVRYFKGTPEETLHAQMSLYSHWLPDSGFEPDNFPMLEHYLNDARVDGYVEMEIQVKLKEI